MTVAVKVGAKGVFLIMPVSDDPKCHVRVPAANGYRIVGCSTQYLMSCDAERAEGQPMCRLAVEAGSDRDSAYPKASVAP